MTVANVLIVGGAGVTGKHILKSMKATKETKWDIKAAVLVSENREEQEKAFSKLEVTTVPLDPSNIDGCVQVMKDIDELVIIPPPRMDKLECAKHCLKSAEKAKVKFVVLVSMYGVDEPDFLFGEAYRQLEECMKDPSYPAHCIVRPQYYVQNLLLLRDQVRKGELPFPIGKGKFAPIDADDVGDAVCKILKEPSAHAGKIYNLTGPESMTSDQIAKVFSKVIGTEVKSTDDAVTAKAHLKQSIPSHELLGVLELYQVIASGKLSESTKDVENLLGHPGASMEQWAKEHVEMFKQ